MIKKSLGVIGISLATVAIVMLVSLFLWQIVAGQIPTGPEYTITGYLNDFNQGTGYGYSFTTLVIDNHSYTFDRLYREDIPINNNVNVIYRYTLNPDYILIERIEVI